MGSTTLRRAAAVVAALSALVLAPAPEVSAAARSPIQVVRLADAAGRPLLNPRQVNEQGQVLAEVRGPSGWAPATVVGVVWKAGRATLVPVPPRTLPYELDTRGIEISELGHVVGTRAHTTGFLLFPFVVVGGRYVALEPEDTTALGRLAVATDVNEQGEALGWKASIDPATGRPERFAVVWQDGEVAATSPAQATPVDLDDLGRALIDVGTASAPSVTRAAVWQIGGTVQDLGTLGGPWSRGAAMNLGGHVVGTSANTAGDEHAFRWRDSRMVDLGTLGGSTSVVGLGRSTFPFYPPAESALNEWGHVVGTSETADGTTHAFLWRDGRMTDLGTLGGANSAASALNELGQVVGWSETASGERHAFLWQNGRMTDLGALAGSGPSEALDVNNRGQIVGTFAGEAVLWTVPPLW